VIDEVAIGERFRALAGELDERRRRLWAAAEARSVGRGGIVAVARASGISEETIRRGVRELESGEHLAPGRVRRPGGGRKRLTHTDPTLLADLEGLVDPEGRGDPERPLRWTARSVRNLAGALRAMGHTVSFRTVARLLHELGYSLQANAKTREGTAHPDRDGQFRHINERVQAALVAGEPVISVDTKKKELVGDFKAVGREPAPKGSPVPVRVHDFRDPVLGKAIPYGIYDLGDDTGWVNVGIDHDTAQFAVASIRGWWEHLGRERYPEATSLTITADCGGSNGARVRLWKVELQKLADETGLVLHVHHYPPGTSKWNKIEHRLFCHITQNWRGRPLTDRVAIVELIGATTTKAGLKVECVLDTRTYEKGIKVRDAEMAVLDITGDPFHPEWNYTIQPRRPRSE
jgi:transposase